MAMPPHPTAKGSNHNCLDGSFELNSALSFLFYLFFLNLYTLFIQKFQLLRRQHLWLLVKENKVI